MKDAEQRPQPLLVAVIVGGVFIAVLMYVWTSVSIPAEHLKDALLFSTLFGIALVTVGVYQALKFSENTQILALDMTKDMLSNSKELFFELYQRSPVPYIMISDKGVIESVNTSMVRLFGMDAKAFVGLRVFEFLVETETQKLEFAPVYFTQGKFINDEEVCLKRPDGVVKWVMFSLYSFPDATGKRKGLLTLVDVTKQKSVDKAKSEFVSLASHQLRSPIAAMRWNVELLGTSGKETMNEMQTAYVEKIGAGLARMDMLVNDFLNVSRFELGTLVPQYEQLDLLAFFKTVLDEQVPFAEKKNMHLETVWDETVGTVKMDSHLLHMITTNLLSNAIKYTPQGGSVRHTVANEGINFVMRVSDSGIGIPAAEHDMIFSKVYRASNTADLPVEGTGLGLYIVKEAAEVLGGTITFESVEGVGTTFTVTLPKQA